MSPISNHYATSASAALSPAGRRVEGTYANPSSEMLHAAARSGDPEAIEFLISLVFLSGDAKARPEHRIPQEQVTAALQTLVEIYQDKDSVAGRVAKSQLDRLSTTLGKLIDQAAWSEAVQDTTKDAYSFPRSQVLSIPSKLVQAGFCPSWSASQAAALPSHTAAPVAASPALTDRAAAANGKGEANRKTSKADPISLALAEQQTALGRIRGYEERGRLLMGALNPMANQFKDAVDPNARLKLLMEMAAARDELVTVEKDAERDLANVTSAQARVGDLVKTPLFGTVGRKNLPNLEAADAASRDASNAILEIRSYRNQAQSQVRPLIDCEIEAQQERQSEEARQISRQVDSLRAGLHDWITRANSFAPAMERAASLSGSGSESVQFLSQAASAASDIAGQAKSAESRLAHEDQAFERLVSLRGEGNGLKLAVDRHRELRSDIHGVQRDATKFMRQVLNFSRGLEQQSASLVTPTDREAQPQPQMEEGSRTSREGKHAASPVRRSSQ